MADDIGFQPISQPAPDDIGFEPMPKMPDTSGIQKTAQANLAANDNKEKPEGGETKPPPTPQQQLDTAAGMPVHAILSGGNVQPPRDVRSQYVKHVQDGTATNSGDFMQTFLHAVIPTIAGVMKQPERTANIAKAALEGVGEGYEGGGVFSEPVTSNVEAGLGGALNIPFRALSSAYSGFQSAAIKAGQEYGAPSLGKDIALAPEALLGMEGNFPHPPVEAPRPLGPWDSPVIKEAVGKQMGKSPDSVIPSDVEQTIAQGGKNILPPAKDFQTVATVMGAQPETVHMVYEETGVKPVQMIDDTQHNPQIASDIKNGQIPEAYEHLVEPKQIAPEQAEHLQVSRDEAAKTFNVVDKDGDHVQGGFNSYEEAKHFVEDKKFEALEKTFEEPKAAKPTAEKTTYERPVDLEKTSTAEQAVIPGAEKAGEGAMAQRGTEAPLRGGAAPIEGGLFDVAGRGQGDIFDQPAKPKAQQQGIATPSVIGKPTSLRGFLSQQSLKAKFNEAHELTSIVKDGKVVTGDEALEYAHDLAKEYGYMPKDSPDRPNSYDSDLANHLNETNGGREAFRDQDADRVAKAREAEESRKNKDPNVVEREAHNIGLDTDPVKGETAKQRNNRLYKAVQDFYKNEAGSGVTYRKVIGDTIQAAEKFAGKLTGNLFQKFADGYIRTFQPELMGDKALRLDAYLAKMKTSLQEAQNSFERHSAAEKKRWNKLGEDTQKEWLYDHGAGRWNEEENPDQAKAAAFYDALRENEKAAGVASDGFIDNYLPILFEKPEEARAFFRSDSMIKKYGNDYFNKTRFFRLMQDADRAGFRQVTYNPAEMEAIRATASHNLIATMNLLKDAESSGLATRATTFGLEKKIAKTETAIADLQAKYKKLFDKMNDPRQMRMENVDPAVSKAMKGVSERMEELKTRLDVQNKEKAENKLTPEQMKELKGGFRIIGPDSKVWNIHQEGAALWHNAMEMKGLWERQGALGDTFRYYSAAKNIYTEVKLALSLFHPLHEALINTAGVIAAPIHHLIQGGKFSDLAWKDVTSVVPIGDGRGIDAWNTAQESRTPQQHADVQRMVEGGFQPTMSYRDTIHFKENWDKAIAKVGTNNLRLIGTALQLPGKVFEPLFNKWIPRLRSEAYFSLTDKALARDPSLATDAGRRGEAFRKISKDIDRSFGQLNQDTLFWDKNVKDAFNASYISGGWKLAQIYNMRGLLQPANIAYKFAKTGEFSKADLTYNMVQAYAYTGVTLAFGAAVNKMLGNPVGKTWEEAKSLSDYVWSIVKDCQFPTVGKNPDGSPIRVSQPSFAKEWFMAARDINEKGIIGGAGKFVYNGTMIPAVGEFLGTIGDGLSDAITQKADPIGKDTLGRHIIQNPLDYHEWLNAGWDGVNPISISSYEQAEEKGSTGAKIAGLAGMPIAGKYIDQTPFAQKVMDLHYEQNPSKGSIYTAKLSAELRSATDKGNTEDVTKIKDEMKRKGMTDAEISSVTKKYSDPLIQHAWKELSAQDQKRLIESASDEEKAKFKVKHE